MCKIHIFVVKGLQIAEMPKKRFCAVIGSTGTTSICILCWNYKHSKSQCQNAFCNVMLLCLYTSNHTRVCHLLSQRKKTQLNTSFKTVCHCTTDKRERENSLVQLSLDGAWFGIIQNDHPSPPVCCVVVANKATVY